MNARVDQLCIRLFAGIVDVVFAACLCKGNSAHMAARCVVFQGHSTGSGDLGISGDCSCGISDGNGDILGVVDGQFFRRSANGAVNGHVTIAGDICAAIHNVAACRKRHFAGIINVQASVHSHTFVAADIHLTGAVDVSLALNCIIPVTGNGHIVCTYSTRIALLSDRQTTSCADAAVQNDIRLRRSDLQHIIDSLFCRQGLFLNVIAEDAVSKDVFIVLSGNRLIIDFDVEILYNFGNLNVVLVQFGDRAKQLAGVNFSFLLTIADINVIVIYSFQRNIAAGDLDVFAFASPSSAAEGPFPPPDSAYTVPPSMVMFLPSPRLPPPIPAASLPGIAVTLPSRIVIF